MSQETTPLTMAERSRIGHAIGNAIEELPAGWEIEIVVRRGEWRLAVRDEDGLHAYLDAPTDSLSAAVRSAVETAIKTVDEDDHGDN